MNKYKMKKHYLINLKIETWTTTHHEVFPTFTFSWTWLDAIEFKIWFDFTGWWNCLHTKMKNKNQLKI